MTRMLLIAPSVPNNSPVPDWQSGGPRGNGNLTLLAYETTKYSLGIGGDIGTGKGGDLGGYNKDYANVTFATGQADTNSIQQPWLPTINSEVNAGNLQAATNTLVKSADSVLITAKSAGTSQLGQGYADLANGTLAAVGTVAGAVGAVVSFSSGTPVGIVGGFGAAAGAISSAETAVKDFSTSAAGQAIDDIINTLGAWLSDVDQFWADGWGDDVIRGVPGAASMFAEATNSRIVMSGSATTHEGETRNHLMMNVGVQLHS